MDVQNRLRESQNGSAINESYLYDDNGQRVKKTSNGVVTYYPFADYHLENGYKVKYYFFNGQPVARYQANGNNFLYLHTDHLGSVVLTTYSGSGGVRDIQTYCVYGKQRSGTTCTAGNDLDTSKHFTGQDYDSTGLHYYRARYYDDHLGQFVSPDTIVPDATNVFDYNRFMYTRGNPLKFNDPSGHQAVCTMDANLNWQCSDNAVTGGETQDINLADSTRSNNPNGTQQFLTTMATIGVVSFGGAFAAPYVASLWPAAVEGGTATATAACADGDCTNEVQTVNNVIQPSNINTAYQIAKEGGNHAGFLRNYASRPVSQIQKGISSIEELIVEHRDKIINPEKYVPNFRELDPRRQEALLTRVWPNDIQRQTEQLEVLKGLVDEILNQ